MPLEICDRLAYLWCHYLHERGSVMGMLLALVRGRRIPAGAPPADGELMRRLDAGGVVATVVGTVDGRAATRVVDAMLDGIDA